MEPMRDRFICLDEKSQGKGSTYSRPWRLPCVHKLDELRVNTLGCYVPFDTGWGREGTYTASRETEKLQRRKRRSVRFKNCD